MQNNKAFTLVELIVGITISIILMVSVGVFVSSGIKNIFSQKEFLVDKDNFNLITDKISFFLNFANKNFTPIISSSGVLIQTSKDFDKGGFSYIGSETLSGVYCLSGSENLETKHLFIKNFIPFEEKEEDIFSDFNSILTGSISIPWGVGIEKYITDQKNHLIYKNNISNIVVGKGIYGDKFIEGLNGTGVYLNSPTGLASSGSILFIADTLNDRILYYDTISNKIYKLLGREDGISEPTGLFYSGALYISNSGLGQVLKYSSNSISSSPNLKISFSPDYDLSDVNKFSIEFFTGVTNMVSLISTGSFTFSGITQYNDYLTGSQNKLEYYFSNSGNLDPTYSEYNNFTGGITYGIEVSNIPNFTNTGAYYLKLSLSGSSNFWESYFPYFTAGDNDITTSGDNILEIFASRLAYPTGIYLSGGYITVNDFSKREWLSYSNTGGLLFSGSLNTFDLSKFIYNKNTDLLLKKPISSIKLDFTNDLFTIIVNYFKSYNCYNLDEKNEKSFIFKKNFK